MATGSKRNGMDRTIDHDRDDEGSLSDELAMSITLDGGDIDEDRLFGAGSDDSFPRPSFDVYSLKGTGDVDIYDKVAAVLHDMAGVKIPAFVLQIVKLSRKRIEETDPDRARRLSFEIDNKILKYLQAMHRAQVCDRIRGFHVKLGKVMAIIYRHFHESIKEVPDKVINELIPNWPDTAHSFKGDKPNGDQKESEDSEVSLKTCHSGINNLSSPEEPSTKDQATGEPVVLHDAVQNTSDSVILPSMASYVSASTMQSGLSCSLEAVCDKATSYHREPPKTAALECGLAFDIFSPEPELFSIYMHPNTEYTIEPKETPVDPDSPCDKQPKNQSSLWKQVKRLTTRVSRTIRGNPKYFVSPQCPHK